MLLLLFAGVSPIVTGARAYATISFSLVTTSSASVV